MIENNRRKPMRYQESKNSNDSWCFLWLWENYVTSRCNWMMNLWLELKILLWKNTQLDDGERFDQSQGRTWIRILLIKLSQKHEFWMMWQTDQRKNMLKNFFIFQWSLVVDVNNGFHFLSKDDEIFVSTFRMRANRLIDL